MTYEEDLTTVLLVRIFNLQKQEQLKKIQEAQRAVNARVSVERLAGPPAPRGRPPKGNCVSWVPPPPILSKSLTVPVLLAY